MTPIVRNSLILTAAAFALSACVVVPAQSQRGSKHQAKKPRPKTRLVVKRAPRDKRNLERHARTVMRDARDLLSTLGGYITCFNKRILQQALRRGDQRYARRVQRSSCMRRMGAVAAANGFKTVTVGISGGGSFIIGGFVDTGFAFDTRGRRAPTLYQTKAISIGFQAGGGVGLNLGLYRGTNRPNTRGVDSHGFSFEGGVGVGAGTAIWYDYRGNFDGLSVSAIAGASGKAGAYNRINTSYYRVNGRNPISCGGRHQRPCKIWERIPSCNKGLREHFLKGKCV